MYEQELKTMILQDMEQLHEDVSDYLKERRKNRYGDWIPGQKCPKCGSTQNSVNNTRTKDGFRTRRKKCSRCGHSWNTIEILYI